MNSVPLAPWPMWEGCPTIGCQQIAETTVKLSGWEPGKHTEAVRSRRQFLVLAAQWVKSGRQRVVKIAVTTQAWRVLKTCYERLSQWIRTTAPQLDRQGTFLRMLVRDTPVDPAQWFAQAVTPPSG